MTVISPTSRQTVNSLSDATKLTTAVSVATPLTQTAPAGSTSVTLGQTVTTSPVYSLGRVPSLPAPAPSQGTLNVQTASGALVEVVAANDGSGVQITVKKGSLTDAERSALTKISDGFQKAMAGLTAQPPHLDLAGLTKFDNNVLRSVDLQAKTTGDNKLTLDFHADSSQRRVKSSGAIGTVDISVDMSKRTLIGSESQQQRALNHYLRQFDRAQQRGEGDSTLMTLFKEAFTALNSHYDTSTSAARSTPQTLYLALNRSDKNMLTGLADFSASVSQSPVYNTNPMRQGEADTFAYQVSQTSTVSGSSDQNRNITQKQQSHLTASFHKALTAGLQLNLSTDKNSQNYFYYQIEDKAESTTEVQYRKGALVSATLDQSASSTTRVQKYVRGWLESDATTPQQTAKTSDLLDRLQAAWKSDASRIAFADYLRQHTLPDFGEDVLLNSDPAAL